MTKKSIGFIGIGHMGSPMATNLAGYGHALYLSDVDVERVDGLCSELGAQPLDAEIAAGLDVLITMLPNSDIVDSVVLGDATRGGWAQQLKAGATVIDMSSAVPERSRALGNRLAELGIAYLDAPVSGGVSRAHAGTLAILVGGDASVLEHHRDILEQMGSTILHVGAQGTGHAAKSLNNYVSAAGLLATVEALHIAKRFDIDPKVMNDVLNASTGRTNTSENKVEQHMLSGAFSSGFGLLLLDKDINIAADLAESLGYEIRLGRTAIEVWDEAARHSDAATDHTEVYRMLDEQ